VPNFAQKAQPLYTLLKKGATWQWGKSQQNSVDELKCALLLAPTLSHDEEDGNLELRTDASTLGLGAVLSLKRETEEQPIIFISRKLTPAETHYHSNELECLALIWSLEKLRSYLIGRKFCVFTDSNALKWLYSKRVLQGKFARWIMALQEFQLTVKHIKGSENVVADALSRCPVGLPELTDPTDRLVCALVGSFYPPSELSLLQQGDPFMRPIFLKLQDPNQNAEVTKEFVLKKSVLYRKNDRVGRRFLLVVPSFLRREILEACHDDPSGGHFGINKTLSKVCERYWWPKMSLSVKTYVKSCSNCQFHKPITGLPVGELLPIPPPTRPFETIGIDHLGPFKRTLNGNQQIAVMMDYLTKWIVAVPVPDNRAPSVIQALRNCVLTQHGHVDRVITDQGKSLKSLEFTKFLRENGIRQVLATEHPQTNGLVERANRTLVSAFRAYVNVEQTDWDLHVPAATFAINTARQDTTQRSPFELIYGRIAVLPHESAFPWPENAPDSIETFLQRVTQWREDAREAILQRQKRSVLTTNQRRKKNRDYQPGDLVLVARRIRKVGMTAKLLPKFIGPCQIVRRTCPTTYLVENIHARQKGKMRKKFMAHQCQIRPFHVRTDEEWITFDSENSESIGAEKRRKLCDKRSRKTLKRLQRK
jgi:ribonuclease HI